MTSLKKSIKYFYIGIMLTLMLLIIAEFTLRFKHQFFAKKNKSAENHIYFSTFGSPHQQDKILKDYQEIDRFAFVPYLLWQAKPNQHTDSFSTNLHGFRGPDWQNDKKNTFRILFTGGSSAWGWGASSDGTTISEYLKTEITKLFRTHAINQDVEVLNLAENGYVSTQELILWKDIPDYHPDLVIHFTGFNDIYTGGISEPAGAPHPFLTNYQLMISERQTIKGLIISNLKNVLEQSYLFRSIKFHLGGYTSTPAKKYTDLATITEVFIRNIKYISYIAQNEKIPVWIILQPTLFNRSKNISPEEVQFLSIHENEYPLQTEYFRKGYSMFSLQLQKLDAEGKILFSDASKIFDDYEGNIFWDQVHYSDTGNKIVAQFIASKLFSQPVWNKIHYNRLHN